MNKLKIVFLIITLSLLNGCYSPKGKIYNKRISPDGKYILEIYQLKLSPSFRTHGDAPQAYVTLKNKQGKIISETSFFNKCLFSTNDLSVEWYKRKENTVYFTNNSYIDINSGEMKCL